MYRNKSIGNLSFANNKAELHTDDSFVRCLNEKLHIGDSPLLNIPGLGVVTCIPLDYMHLCCLGIMKKILFENYLLHFKKIIQFGRAPLVKLYNRINEEYNNNYKFNSEFCTNYSFLDRFHCRGP